MRNGAQKGRRRNAAVDVKDRSNSISGRSSATRTSEEIATIAEFKKNGRGETVRVSLSRLNGTVIADIRTYFLDKSGNSQASKKGLALLVTKLPELADALQKAVTEARQRGVL